MSDFDFLYGEWDVHNRRLRELFAGSREWYSFEATAWAQPLLGGIGIVDEMDCPSEGFAGATVRLQDQVSGEWSIYWADSTTGRLFPPVVGGFDGGRGDFFGDDEVDSHPIRAHFTWSEITPESARWEQEFSLDGGQTWECNWVMEFTRRS